MHRSVVTVIVGGWHLVALVGTGGLRDSSKGGAVETRCGDLYYVID